MKAVQITLRNKISGEVNTYFCHHYMGDSQFYYLNGVKGKSAYGEEIIFNKKEWEKI